MIDSNIILDIATEDPIWFDWSSKIVSSLAESHILVINSIIYTEVSIGFNKIEEVEEILSLEYFTRETIPWEACFLAGKCFIKYRKNGGTKLNPLPNFFIGSHALINGYPLLTRDNARYQSYFPRLQLIKPGDKF